MTKRNRYLHKFWNAVRAFKGGFYTHPQKKAKARVEIWMRRCTEAGYLKHVAKP